MRLLRILTFIGFVAVSIGLAVRFWIDGLPSIEPFRGALPELPTGAGQVVTASKQLGGPPGTRSSQRPPSTGQPGGRFTIGLGRAPVASATTATGAAGAGEAPAPPRAAPPPSSPPPQQPPAPAPAPPPPTAPGAPPNPPPPAPTPSPPAPAAPATPPTAAPSTPKPHPKPAPTPSTPAPPSGPTQPPPPAAPGSDTSKPGWGHGDENHDHSGPPGANDQSDKKESGKKR